MAKGTIIGIDLGTSNSCVAVRFGDRTEIVRNELGDRTTPSVVAFADDGSVLVGQRAYRQAVMNPARTLVAVKRLVGRGFDSPEVVGLRRTLPYDVVRARNGDAWVAIGDRQVSPAEAQAHILVAMRDAAESFVGAPIREAVITVPAFFDEAQRQATRDAAEIAGLRALRLLSEPTAAALAYGFAKARNHNIVVFDLGGGTLDVTVMAVDGGRFEVLSTAGELLLGGADFDRALAEAFAAEIERERGVDLSGNRVALQRLVAEAELAKKTLTELDSVVINLPYLATTPTGPIDFERRLTRDEFARLVAPMVDRMLDPCRLALDEAGVTASQIDDVILVGGMTRTPAVQAAVERFFGRRPSLRINPDEAIAMGAALLAGILEGSVDAVDLVDVVPRTIGLRVAGGNVAHLIRRSSPLPASVTKAFATTRDDQRNVELQVVQGESDVASDNRSLASILVDGFPPLPRGQVKLAVTFSVDVDGVLAVSARRVGADDSVHVEVTAASGLGRAEVQRLAKEQADRRAARGGAEPSGKASASPLQFKGTESGRVAAVGGQASARGFAVSIKGAPGQPAPAAGRERPAAARAVESSAGARAAAEPAGGATPAPAPAGGPEPAPAGGAARARSPAADAARWALALSAVALGVLVGVAVYLLL
jgi:molecular chaperone DnaK